MGIFISGKIFSDGKQVRIPYEYDGIQANFCKNPKCTNFGVLPLSEVSLGRRIATSVVDSYIINNSADGRPSLRCKICNETPTIKSNLGIAEEVKRFQADITIPSPSSCPDLKCANHQLPIGKGYQSIGSTRSGSKRYRCNVCQKTFSIGKSTNRQKQPHKNKLIFSLLMNKSPFRRICEVADIGPESVYGKLDFLYQQALKFVAVRETRLLNGMHIPRLYIGVDRQDYVVNWTASKDKRNVTLKAVGSADNETGYVFGMHLNYDPNLNAELIEADAIANHDYLVKPPFRRYARCWLKEDYIDSQKNISFRKRQERRNLSESIAANYDEAALREDSEVSETQDKSQRLPTNGMQIHAEYTLYGHFFYLKNLLKGVDKVSLFLDQDSGIRAAFISAFQSEIVARRADAFYVSINKEMTISEKRAFISRSRAEFDEARKLYPELNDSELESLLIKERIANMSTLGKWQDKWMQYPFPNMSEPKKAVSYLTDYGDYDEDYLARLYKKASLHAIDRFFMQVRRRLSILERPITSSSSQRRTWHGYSAYNPETIVKMLGIFRVFYNYCLVGQDGKTPAMRLGLAKGKVSLEDIIYF